MPIGAIALVGAFVNTAAGMYQGYQTMQQGQKLEEQYQADIDNYQRDVRENVYRGMRAPTEREQIAREDIGRSTATAIDSASKMGVRGLSVMPQILRREQNVLDDVAASFEEKRMRIQQLIASDDARLQQMKFQEENMELQALGQGLTSAQQMEQSGKDAMWGALQQGAGAGINIAQGQQEMNLMRDIYGVGGDTSKIERLENRLGGLPADSRRAKRTMNKLNELR